jgi:hypothetical protein
LCAFGAVRLVSSDLAAAPRTFGAVRAPQARYSSLLVQRRVTRRKHAPDYATALDQPLALGPALLPRGILPRVAVAAIHGGDPAGFSQSQWLVERFIRG